MFTLIRFKRYWADEFQCEEFVVLAADEQRTKDLIHDALEEKGQDFWFGTNEGFGSEYNNELEPSDFTTEELTIGTAQGLFSLFGKKDDQIMTTTADSIVAKFGTGVLDQVIERGLDVQEQGKRNNDT